MPAQAFLTPFRRRGVGDDSEEETAGKLVVLSKHLRDVHRFGFETLEKLAAEGDKQVAAALATINTYPEVAKA